MFLKKLLCAFVIVLLAETTMSALDTKRVANLAIVYTEGAELKQDDYNLAINGALSLTLRGLLHSQAAPIIVSGDIAYALLTLGALQYENVTFSAAEQELLNNFADCSNASQETKNNAKSVVEGYWKKVQDPEEANPRESLKIVLQLLYELNSHCFAFPAWWPVFTTLAGSAGFSILYKTLVETPLSAWEIYLYQEREEKKLELEVQALEAERLQLEASGKRREAARKEQRKHAAEQMLTIARGKPEAEKKKLSFVLLVPRSYTAAMKRNPSMSDADAIGLRIDENTVLQHFENNKNSLDNLLKLITPPPSIESIKDPVKKQTALQALVEQEKYGQAGVARALAAMFKKLPDLTWNIYMMGHGLVREDTAATPVTAMLASSGRSAFIAGMPAQEFLRLLLFFNTLPANIVVWQSCYGGGYNAQAAVQMLALQDNMRLKALLQQGKTPQEIEQLKELVQQGKIPEGIRQSLRSFYAASLASIDRPTKAKDEPFFDPFFYRLARLFENPLAGIDVKAAITKAIRSISDEPPIILMPQKSAFELADVTLFGERAFIIDKTGAPNEYVYHSNENNPANILLMTDEVISPIKINSRVVPVIESRLPGQAEHNINRIEDTSGYGVEEFLIKAFFATEMDGNKNKPVRGFDVFLKIFNIRELTIANKNAFAGIQADPLVLRDVMVIRFPEYLATGGWIVFVYDDGKERKMYTMEIFGDQLRLVGLPVVIDSEKTKNRLVHDRRDQILTNEMLEELAYAGKEQLVFELILLCARGGALRSSITVTPFPWEGTITKHGFQEILLEEFQKRGLPLGVLPTPGGFNAALRDSVAAGKTAIAAMLLGTLGDFISIATLQDSLMLAEKRNPDVLKILSDALAAKKKAEAASAPAPEQLTQASQSAAEAEERARRAAELRAQAEEAARARAQAELRAQAEAKKRAEAASAPAPEQLTQASQSAAQANKKVDDAARVAAIAKKKADAAKKKALADLIKKTNTAIAKLSKEIKTLDMQVRKTKPAQKAQRAKLQNNRKAKQNERDKQKKILANAKKGILPAPAKKPDPKAVAAANAKKAETAIKKLTGEIKQLDGQIKKANRAQKKKLQDARKSKHAELDKQKKILAQARSVLAPAKKPTAKPAPRPKAQKTR